MLYAVLKPFAVALMRLFFRLEAVNPAAVPATGPVLLVSNHVSVLDPPLIGGAAPRPLSFMAKEELFRIPLVITGRSHVFAVVVVGAAALASTAIVRRRLDHLDLVAVLKTRE